MTAKQATLETELSTGVAILFRSIFGSMPYGASSTRFTDQRNPSLGDVAYTLQGLRTTLEGVADRATQGMMEQAALDRDLAGAAGLLARLLPETESAK